METENRIFGYQASTSLESQKQNGKSEEGKSLPQNRKHWNGRVERLMRPLLLHGESRRFTIYQMDSGDEHTYQFVEIESAKNADYTIDGKDYPGGWFMQHRGCQQSR